MSIEFPDSIRKVNDIKDVAKRLRHASIYLCVVILFSLLFSCIVPYYMNVSKEFNGPIDTRAWECKCFDPQYVNDVKENGIYKFSEYLKSFVPMDLVYPVIYTLMFLTLLNARRNKTLYNGTFKTFYDIFFYLVVAGMSLDYMENLSFLLHLKTQIDLSFLVAALTTIKTLFFLANLVGFAIALFRTSVMFFKYRTYLKDSSPFKEDHPQL